LNTQEVIKKSISEKEFEIIFKEYFKPLVYFAYKFLKDVELSKEIVHDVFVNIWEKIDKINSEKSIKSYLYTSVNNRCLNYIRDNKKFVSDEILTQNYDTNSNSDKLIELEIQKIITYTLENLPQKTKIIFELSRNENLKYKEIAEKLNISQKTVEAHMSQALKEFHKNLKDYITILYLIFFLNL